MNIQLPRLLVGIALAALGLAGCQHCCQRRPAAVRVAPVPPPGAPGAYLPPQAIPQAPPGVLQAPPPPVPVPEGTSGYPAPPQPAAHWQAPAGSGVQLGVAGDQTPEPPRDAARLYPPEPAAPGAARPGVSEQPSAAASPPLPVGIPQFANVKEGVSTGLKPDYLDGLDWLKAKGYKTVLHLRGPGEDDAADRKQFKKRGLTYQSLEVSPQTLTREVVEEFNRFVTDQARQPLFVYDKSGVLAGGLWYLHFRTVDRDGDDVARIRAGQLGLKENQDGDQKAMWLAIQRLLSQQQP